MPKWCICPKCKSWKAKHSKMCMKCWRKVQEEKWEDFNKSKEDIKDGKN